MTEMLPNREMVSAEESYSTSKEALLDKLDSSLEEYLRLLDEYQKTREQLSSQLASGFLSLAHANFNATSNMRYGQDYYDDRMKASRRVAISEESASSLSIFSVEATGLDPAASSTNCDTLSSGDLSETEGKATDAFELPTEPKPKLIDPIRWYGLVVPQALRTAQTRFVSTVEAPVPYLCSVSREMRNLETEIAKIRKQLRRF